VIRFLRGRWDDNGDLVRRRTELSSAADRNGDVVVRCAVLDKVVNAAGSDDGSGVDLLTLRAGGILFCDFFFLAPIQAVAKRLVVRVTRSRAGIPRQGDVVMARSTCRGLQLRHTRRRTNRRRRIHLGRQGFRLRSWIILQFYVYSRNVAVGAPGCRGRKENEHTDQEEFVSPP